MGNSYTAVSAKVHALYGNRFSEEDYRQLSLRNSVPAAAQFLRSHPGYQEGFAGVNVSDIHREGLEICLRSVYLSEYRRLFRFMGITDKALMRYPMIKAEQIAILTACNMLQSSNPLTPDEVWLDYLTENSKLDLDLLRNASTFQDIVRAAEDTVFAPYLKRIPTETGVLPDMTFTDNMMQAAFYAFLYKTLATNYRVDSRSLIRQSLDAETDLLNLVQFLRLRQYFSDEDVRRYSFPFPCSAKLNRNYVQQLLAAPDYSSAFDLVQNGPYGHLFVNLPAGGLETYVYLTQYQFSVRQLRSGQPSIYTPVAYLTLKEIEIRNIISIVECIRYQVSPSDFVTLIGVKEVI